MRSFGRELQPSAVPIHPGRQAAQEVVAGNINPGDEQDTQHGGQQPSQSWDWVSRRQSQDLACLKSSLYENERCGTRVYLPRGGGPLVVRVALLPRVGFYSHAPQQLNFSVVLPDKFPLEAPRVVCENAVLYHPNCVASEWEDRPCSEVRMPLLSDWRPSSTLLDVVHALQTMLLLPVAFEPARPEVARMMESNITLFKARVDHHLEQSWAGDSGVAAAARSKRGRVASIVPADPALPLPNQSPDGERSSTAAPVKRRRITEALPLQPTTTNKRKLVSVLGQGPANTRTSKMARVTGSGVGGSRHGYGLLRPHPVRSRKRHRTS